MPGMSWFVLAVYVAAPFLALRSRRAWSVPLAVVLLWAPLEFGLLTHFGWSPVLAISLGMLTALLAFRSRPDVIDLRKSFRFSAGDLKRGAQNWLMFGAIGIPLGLWMDFIRFGFDPGELPGVPLMLVTIFLFNALPEEILFRGVIQNWIEKGLGSEIAALVLASLVFGAAHLNNGTPVPNWKYFAMASIAGLFYGRAWRARKNVIASALTHALVNTSWSVFFR